MGDRGVCDVKRNDVLCVQNRDCIFLETENQGSSVLIPTPSACKEAPRHGSVYGSDSQSFIALGLFAHDAHDGDFGWTL